MTDPTIIEKEIWIDAAPAEIFDYLVDPQKLRLWCCVEAQVDARVGGAYRFNITGANIASGTFREISRPHRVVYTWGWEGSESVPVGSSTVEITLAEVAGRTRLHFIHRGLSEDAAALHEKGWSHYYGRLALAATGADAGPDSNAVPAGERKSL
ncbi:MAG: SRPBCC domain-containing protein [Alphaproteobacteria bacterium]